MNAENKNGFEALLEYAFRHRNGSPNRQAYTAACEDAAREICEESGNAAQLVSEGYDRILEIGGYYGAFTEQLALKCAELVCAECDENRRRLIGIRCPNVRLRGNIPDGRFGLIWVNGCDESLSDYGFSSLQNAYSTLSERLTENGEMIFLLPQKYLSETESTFGKDLRIIYPYPDLKGTVFFFTDDRPPKKSELFFDETLCSKNTDEKSFSDIFIAIVKKAPRKDKLIFSKMSVSRKAEYRIRTDIVSGDKKYAVKIALPESTDHVDRMEYSYKKLSEIYSRGLISVNRAEKISNGQVRFDFEEGEELFDIIVSTAKDDPQTAWEYVYRYSEILRSKAQIPFEFTEDFYKMFGRSLKSGDFYSCGYTNIDFCFDNIIVRDGRWIVTDYEFCADFPVPVDFVIFRSVFYMFRKMPSETVSPEWEEKIYARLGIEKHTEAFRRMEYNFQRYITGDNIYYSQVIKKCRECENSPEKAIKKLSSSKKL